MKISFRKLWVCIKTAILTDPVQSGKLDLGPGISVGFIFNPPSKFLGANFVSYLTFPEWKQFSLVLVWHSPGDFLGFGVFFSPWQALKMPRKHGPSHAGPHQPSNRFLARQFPSLGGFAGPVRSIGAKQVWFYRKEMWLVCHTGRGSGAEQLAGMSLETPTGIPCCIKRGILLLMKSIVGHHRSFMSNTSRGW